MRRATMKPPSRRCAGTRRIAQAHAVSWRQALRNSAGSTRRAPRSTCSLSPTRISQPATGSRRSPSATPPCRSISLMASARPAFRSDGPACARSMPGTVGCGSILANVCKSRGRSTDVAFACSQPTVIAAKGQVLTKRKGSQELSCRAKTRYQSSRSAYRPGPGRDGRLSGARCGKVEGLWDL